MKDQVTIAALIIDYAFLEKNFTEIIDYHMR